MGIPSRTQYLSPFLGGYIGAVQTVNAKCMKSLRKVPIHERSQSTFQNAIYPNNIKHLTFTVGLQTAINQEKPSKISIYRTFAGKP